MSMAFDSGVEKPGLNSHHNQDATCPAQARANGVPLKVQASGHKIIHGVSGEQMPAVVDLGDGFILKALQEPPRGEQELRFYQQVVNNGSVDPDLQALKPFLPQFAGTVERNEKTYLKLSNLVGGYHRPCVMDLKMGRITYDSHATQEKKSRELKKFPPAKQLGFQITGMMIFDPLKDAYDKITKDYTRKLTEETIVSNGLSLFFRLHGEHSREDLLPPLLVKLRMLEQWFSQQNKLSFIASSLLITYEGYQQINDKLDLAGQDSPERGQGDSHAQMTNDKALDVIESVDAVESIDFSGVFKGNQEYNSLNKIGLHLIDFAHVFPADSIDHNVLFGIRKLISCLQSMIS